MNKAYKYKSPLQQIMQLRSSLYSTIFTIFLTALAVACWKLSFQKGPTKFAGPISLLLLGCPIWLKYNKLFLGLVVTPKHCLASNFADTRWSKCLNVHY